MLHLSTDYIAFKNAHHFLYSLVLSSHYVPPSFTGNLYKNVMKYNEINGWLKTFKYFSTS